MTTAGQKLRTDWLAELNWLRPLLRAAVSAASSSSVTDTLQRNRASFV
jgi:hypothetical protein